MTESKEKDSIEPAAQRSFWNAWNAKFRVGNWKVPETNARQAEIVISWLEKLGRRDLQILEVGCGSGWMCNRLAEFGHVVGIDISDQIIGKNADRTKDIEFIAGDFLVLDLPARHFDVVVTLEVIAHVSDQAAFVARLAEVLRDDGHLALAAQNRIALSRWSNVQPVAEGQIRKWLTPRELKKMLLGGGSLQERDAIELPFIREDLGIGEARMIVDRHVHIAPACSMASPDPGPGKTMARSPETAELLDIEVEQIAGSTALVAVGLGRRLKTALGSQTSAGGLGTKCRAQCPIARQ